MPKVIAIPCDPSRPLRLEEASTLEQYQALVGGYIECVFINVVPQHAILVLDEEGLLKQLPINHRAMALMLLLGYRLTSPLVGDAFLCGKAGEEFGDAPSWAIEWAAQVGEITESEEFREQLRRGGAA